MLLLVVVARENFDNGHFELFNFSRAMTTQTSIPRADIKPCDVNEANEDDTCSSPDSFIGIGGKYEIHNVCFPGVSTFPASGNIASCDPDNGKVNIKSMGYILVR
jgi:hypothetical protein